MTLGAALWAVILAAGGLLCLKVVWNLTVPYVLLARRLGGRSDRGISMMLLLDLLLLVVATLTAALLGRPWPWSPGGVALWGGALIAGSYLHFVVACVVGGWLVSLLRGRGRGTPR